jgi:restriction endonuclease S subunit
LPSIDVQKQIVEILSTLDKKIDAENLNRDRLKLLKAGLMSDIFGQKVQIN